MDTGRTVSYATVARSTDGGIPISRSTPRTRRRAKSEAMVETPKETVEIEAAMRIPM